MYFFLKLFFLNYRLLTAKSDGKKKGLQAPKIKRPYLVMFLVYLILIAALTGAQCLGAGKDE